MYEFLHVPLTLVPCTRERLAAMEYIGLVRVEVPELHSCASGMMTWRTSMNFCVGASRFDPLNSGEHRSSRW